MSAKETTKPAATGAAVEDGEAAEDAEDGTDGADARDQPGEAGEAGARDQPEAGEAGEAGARHRPEAGEAGETDDDEASAVAEVSAPDEPAVPDEVLAPTPRETTLARRRDPVDAFLGEARRHPRLSEADEKTLSVRARAGDLDAARRLVLHNLRLVVSIAYQYRRAWANILDLFQEGAVGLMEAVRRWEPALGTRFGSYAAYWIRAYILKFLMTNARLIHVGNTRAGRKLFFRLEKERQRLLAAGFEPTPQLLAAALDVDEADVVEVSRHLDSREVSTEAQMGGEGPTLGEGIAARQATPEEQAARSELGASVGKLMRAFEGGLTDERERVIWHEHLAAQEPASLGELGQRFKLSKQRMGQIAARLKKRFRAELVEELGADIQMAWTEGE